MDLAVLSRVHPAVLLHIVWDRVFDFRKLKSYLVQLLCYFFEHAITVAIFAEWSLHGRICYTSIGHERDGGIGVTRTDYLSIQYRYNIMLLSIG